MSFYFQSNPLIPTTAKVPEPQTKLWLGGAQDSRNLDVQGMNLGGVPNLGSVQKPTPLRKKSQGQTLQLGGLVMALGLGVIRKGQ